MHKRSIFTTDEILVLQDIAQKSIKRWEEGLDKTKPGYRPDPKIIETAKSALEKLVWGEAAAGTAGKSVIDPHAIDVQSMTEYILQGLKQRIDGKFPKHPS